MRPLINALDRNRLHHAFLFVGTRGVGKTTIARILAKSLNCETGVTSQPCGKCSACLEVDEGRFVDLIEVDAASRTKVDDTRELLDNVQYAPTRGRYKVYLIDEVHMLSGHSFNALLKTLEEPPPHVKFLLATTDPQKLPVTVLSRCLQFNLKRLSVEQISQQLMRILQAENVEHDAASLALLARGADGSMRDGLSLLDQAIAYGGGKLKETDVRSMLGTIDYDSVHRCLEALGAGNAAGLLAVMADVVEHGAEPESLLDELLRALHEIALIQAEAISSEDERLRAHAQAITPSDVQLYYQIGVLGRRDLPYAPDPRDGVEMTLLRMLAFRPGGEGPSKEKPTVTRSTTSPTPVSVAKRSAATVVREQPRLLVETSSAPAEEITAVAEAVPPYGLYEETANPIEAAPVPDGASGWAQTVAQLKLSGFVRELANNTVLESHIDDAMSLVLDEVCGQLLKKEREVELKQALEEQLGRPIKLTIRIGKPPSETPTKERLRLQNERQQDAVQSLQDDPVVRAMQDRFGARVTPNSIRPKA